jgi:hypothetical protein
LLHKNQIDTNYKIWQGDLRGESILGENGLPDIEKVNPFIYDHVGPHYYALGEFLGKAYSVGRKK